MDYEPDVTRKVKHGKESSRPSIKLVDLFGFHFGFPSYISFAQSRNHFHDFQLSLAESNLALEIMSMYRQQENILDSDHGSHGKPFTKHDCGYFSSSISGKSVFSKGDIVERLPPKLFDHIKVSSAHFLACNREFENNLRLANTETICDTLSVDPLFVEDWDRFLSIITPVTLTAFLSVPPKLKWDSKRNFWKCDTMPAFACVPVYTIGMYAAHEFEKAIWESYLEWRGMDSRRHFRRTATESQMTLLTTFWMQLGQNDRSNLIEEVIQSLDSPACTSCINQKGKPSIHFPPAGAVDRTQATQRAISSLRQIVRGIEIGFDLTLSFQPENTDSSHDFIEEIRDIVASKDDIRPILAFFLFIPLSIVGTSFHETIFRSSQLLLLNRSKYIQEVLIEGEIEQQQCSERKRERIKEKKRLKRQKQQAKKRSIKSDQKQSSEAGSIRTEDEDCDVDLAGKKENIPQDTNNASLVQQQLPDQLEGFSGESTIQSAGKGHCKEDLMLNKVQNQEPSRSTKHYRIDAGEPEQLVAKTILQQHVKAVEEDGYASDGENDTGTSSRPASQKRRERTKAKARRERKEKARAHANDRARGQHELETVEISEPSQFESVEQGDTLNTSLVVVNRSHYSRSFDDFSQPDKSGSVVGVPVAAAPFGSILTPSSEPVDKAFSTTIRPASRSLNKPSSANSPFLPSNPLGSSPKPFLGEHQVLSPTSAEQLPISFTHAYDYLQASSAGDGSSRWAKELDSQEETSLPQEGLFGSPASIFSPRPSRCLERVGPSTDLFPWTQENNFNHVNFGAADSVQRLEKECKQLKIQVGFLMKRVDDLTRLKQEILAEYAEEKRTHQLQLQEESNKYYEQLVLYRDAHESFLREIESVKREKEFFRETSHKFQAQVQALQVAVDHLQRYYHVQVLSRPHLLSFFCGLNVSILTNQGKSDICSALHGGG